MAADVAVVGEAAAAAAKKRGASRSWILFDAAGEERVLDADKYAIMHRVDINARPAHPQPAALLPLHHPRARHRPQSRAYKGDRYSQELLDLAGLRFCSEILQMRM